MLTEPVWLDSEVAATGDSKANKIMEETAALKTNKQTADSKERAARGEGAQVAKNSL